MVTETVSVLPAGAGGSAQFQHGVLSVVVKLTDVMVTGLLGWLNPPAVFAVV